MTEREAMLRAEIDCLRYQLRELSLRTYDGLAQERDRYKKALQYIADTALKGTWAHSLAVATLEQK